MAKSTQNTSRNQEVTIRDVDWDPSQAPRMLAEKEVIANTLEEAVPFLKISTDDNIMSHIGIIGSFQEPDEWPNKIFENSQYFRFGVTPAKGRYYNPGDKMTVELISVDYKLPNKKFRKYTSDDPQKIADKILKWIDENKDGLGSSSVSTTGAVRRNDDTLFQMNIVEPIKKAMSYIPNVDVEYKTEPIQKVIISGELGKNQPFRFSIYSAEGTQFEGAYPHILVESLTPTGSREWEYKTVYRLSDAITKISDWIRDNEMMVISRPQTTRGYSESTDMDYREVEPGFRISYEVITEDSLADGDVADRGWVSEEVIPVDDRTDEDIEDGVTLVDKAIEFLRDKGVVEASVAEAGKYMNTTDWFTAYGDWDYETDTQENTSYHPIGFTAQELRDIAKGLRLQ